MDNSLECRPVMLTIPLDDRMKPINYIGKLFKNMDGVLNIPRDEDDISGSITWFKNEPQHLYLVSDKEIKKGDRFLYGLDSRYIGQAKQPWNDASIKFFPESFKIEVTTDNSLNLPLIPQSFIQEYVEKKGKIDKVKIKMIPRMKQIFTDGLSQCIDDEGNDIYDPEITDGEVIILPIKGSFTKEDMKSSFWAGYDKRNDMNINGPMHSEKPEFGEWFDKNY